MDSIEDTWKHVNKTRTKEQWIKSIQDWSKLEAQKLEHLDCGGSIIHTREDHKICEHLSDNVCSRYGCCAWCDQMHQPMLANPKNKPHVLKYCKLGASILYPNDD